MPRKNPNKPATPCPECGQLRNTQKHLHHLREAKTCKTCNNQIGSAAHKELCWSRSAINHRAKLKREARVGEGICTLCPDQAAPNHTKCGLHAEEQRLAERGKRSASKDKVFDHYGRSCACCGEDVFEFLSIDHMNNDGAKHRAEIGVSRLYPWLIKNNFPNGFQTLCVNCNKGKFLNKGECPHKTRPLRQAKDSWLEL